MNFWDIITRYCYLVGCIPSFVGRKLVIRPGRALFTALNREYTDTPFRPNAVRTSENGADIWGIRRLVYGRDIESMKITRRGELRPWATRGTGVDEEGKTQAVGGQGGQAAMWPQTCGG